MKRYAFPDGRNYADGEAFALSVSVGVTDAGKPITDTVSFPGNWLANASPEWLAENKITVSEVPDAPPAPFVAPISMLQAKLALYAHAKEDGTTLLAAVEMAVAAAGGTVAIYWSTAQTLDRSHPIISQLGAAIGLAAEEIDALFIEAATL